jgi:hypothetical protein
VSAARKVREYGVRPVLALVPEPKEEPKPVRWRRCPTCDAPGAVAPGSPRETVCASCEVQEVLL